MQNRAYQELERRTRGFTLIELVAVIVILGCLATVAVPLALDLRRAAKVAVLESIATTIVTNMLAAQTAWQVQGGTSVTINGSSIPVETTGLDDSGITVPLGVPTRIGMYLMLGCGSTTPADGVWLPCQSLPGYNIAQGPFSPVMVSPPWSAGGYPFACYIEYWPRYGFDPAWPANGTTIRRGHLIYSSAC